MNALAQSSHDWAAQRGPDRQVVTPGGGSRAQTGPSFGLRDVAWQPLRGMNAAPFGGTFPGPIALATELRLPMKTFTKPLALSLALSAALAAPAWADPAAFTVLTLEQAPGAEAMPALAAQLKSLKVDAVSVRQVQRGIGQVDPLQVLADGLGYEYRFIAAGKDDGQTQRGQAVLTRLPIAAESGPDQPGLNYLRLDDGRHTVAVYTDAGAGAAQLPALVTRSRLGAPAVLLGAVAGESATAAGFDPARVALEADASYFSDGFQAASSAPFKVEGSSLRATLLTLAYAADTHGDTPWMDTTLNADARAALLLKAMTEDEKFQMLHSYFGLGKDGGPLPEGAVGSAGFVPAVPRLGIPSQRSCACSCRGKRGRH